MPSPTALALSISMTAADAARHLREGLTFVNSPTPFGPSKGVPVPEAKNLYRFFEQSMVAVTFAFNAIEIFSNQVIADELKESSFAGPTRRGLKDLDSVALQRRVSTEEKVSEIVPELLHIPSPKESGVWTHFETLNRVRNSTIHMKDFEALKRNPPDEVSLFHEFFVARTPITYPMVAINVIGMLRRAVDPEPRWLVGAKAIFESIRS
jgi:hypothetical protein